MCDDPYCCRNRHTCRDFIKVDSAERLRISQRDQFDGAARTSSALCGDDRWAAVGYFAAPCDGFGILVRVLNRIQSPRAVENVFYFIFSVGLFALAFVLRGAERKYPIDCEQQSPCQENDIPNRDTTGGSLRRGKLYAPGAIAMHHRGHSCAWRESLCDLRSDRVLLRRISLSGIGFGMDAGCVASVSSRCRAGDGCGTEFMVLGDADRVDQGNHAAAISLGHQLQPHPLHR